MDIAIKYAEILPDLNFISKIKTGYKINTITKKSNSDNLITNIIRNIYWRNESRETTYLYLKNVIKKALFLYKKYPDVNFQKKINESSFGLNNIKKTYYKDIDFVYKLDKLIKKINKYINLNED